MFLWWGPELIQFYNDAYLPSFGRGKHPAAMGQRGADCWQEIWPIIHPQIVDVLEQGKASWNENQLVPIQRNGRIEEVYWTYGYSPVFDESDQIRGVLVVCTETTAGVLAVRRLGFIRALASALNDAENFEDIAEITARGLAQAPLDMPYSVINMEGAPAICVGLAGTDSPALFPPETDGPLALHELERAVPCLPWPERVSRAVVHRFDGRPAGTLTFGLSPRLPFDAAYASFLQQVAEQVAIAHSRISIGIERRRLLVQAPVAAALMTGPEHVFEIANPLYTAMVGREVLGRRFRDVFPELLEQELPRILDRVYQHGEPFKTQEIRVPL